MLYFLFCFLIILAAMQNVYSTCANPEIISNSYTTEDATILTHIAYISEFTVKCDTGSISNLYTLMNENVQPVALIAPNKYQISWSEDVKSARTGDITIKIYDDEGYTLLRKAQRVGDDLQAVPSLGAVTINHPGTYKGPWISCECLAVIFSLIICYYAIHFRTKLLA